MDFLKLIEKNTAHNSKLLEKFKNTEIQKRIRVKYSLEDELAVQRKRDTEPEEFKAYYDYVEQCKTEVKELISKINKGV